MKKYRKKPVVIKAILWDEKKATLYILESHGMKVFAKTTNQWDDSVTRLKIKTVEGSIEASLGDYIIRGIKGEFYPCKPDIFWMTYEAEE